jgi:patatin-related protein
MSTNFEDSDKPRVDFDQEVRFAVVMYGGSSLAIYINGVAQELLRLVRATAPEFVGGASGERAHLPDEELRGSERVYRRLGRLLGRQGVRPEHVADEDSQRELPIRTRFVVDILTGTSAGGINAVYLAKALASDQDVDELKKLWVSEGDIGVLINDEGSYDDLEFKLGDDTGEPWSVLNSRRMYLKLLQALRGMDEKRRACQPGESPLVDELDLFVTATDMPGRLLQLRLADDVVSEYRHRNVFRFRYRSARASDIDHSDFGPQYNAFLAFAARATSAHQAAFSPIRLNDVAPIVGKYAAKGEHPAEDKALRAFYKDYLLQRVGGEEVASVPPDPDALAEAFRAVWFVDGGTLDNKPFSFVVGELPLRHADTFVDRKLLYVEPSPEHLGWSRSQQERPRIAENALAALSSLPRYETIVEDLTRLLERNRMVERLDRIMRGMDADLIHMPPKQSRTREQFRQMLEDREKLLDWMRNKGTSWWGYQRLRVAEVTDDLTLLVARAADFSEESDEFMAIRYLVGDWRASRYDPHMDDAKRSEVEFLVEFDLLWAVRRIQFVIKKLNDLTCLDKNAQRIAGVPRCEKLSSVWPKEREFAEFREATRRLRAGLNEVFVCLRGERRRLWSPGELNPFIASIAGLQIGSRHLLELLREPTDAKRREKAEQLLNAPLESQADGAEPRLRGDAIADLTLKVKTELERVAVEARDKLSTALRPPKDKDAAARLPRWELFLRETLWYYYVYFDEFDQIAYPMLYSTGVGAETDVIDVFRVSPEDATALIDENHPVDREGQKVTGGAAGRSVRKLAGTTLGNFGAFFERKFRVNDIMWGRLDGAERVIAALLPAHEEELRERMTEQAHRAILVEEMLFADERAAADKTLQSLLWRALDVWDDVTRRAQLLDEAAQRLPAHKSSTDKSLAGPTFREYLDMLSGGADPRDVFRERFVKNYDEGREFTPEATLQSAKRVNRVISDMALGYFPTKGGSSWKRRLAMWLGRRVRIFTEAAIEPDGLARRTQLWTLAACYLLSLLILTLVCLPAFVLLLSSSWPWPASGFLAILLLATLPLALLPFLLTLGYSVVSRKLRGKLDRVLPRASGDRGQT